MKNSGIKSPYDFSLDRIIEEVKARKSRRVLLQFPDGLLRYATSIADRIRAESKSEAIVSLDSCYGACDLAINAATQLKADLIIHFGHARWRTRHGIPVIYAEVLATTDINSLLPVAKKLLEGSRRIGVVSTVQHIHQLGGVKRYLEDCGFKVVVGRAAGKVAYDGQVLGCDYSTAKSISDDVDRFVLIGGGRFHAVGLSLATRKEAIVIDPYSQEVSTTRNLLRSYLKSRYACMMEARSANVFGVVVGLKPGQQDLAEALNVRDKLEKSGKRVILFCVDNLTPERLNAVEDIGAFVITACPRLAIDDSGLFRKPVLTSDEAEMLLSDRLLKEYLSSA